MQCTNFVLIIMQIAAVFSSRSGKNNVLFRVSVIKSGVKNWHAACNMKISLPGQNTAPIVG
jgi:hypothetical protein